MSGFTVSGSSMDNQKTGKKKTGGRVMWGFIYVGAFIAAFTVSAILKMKVDPFAGKYTVHWDSSV